MTHTPEATLDPFIPPLILAFNKVLPPHSLVIDMGANEGTYGNFLADQGHEVISVEHNFTAAEKGQRNAKRIGSIVVHNHFIIGDIAKPMFKDEQFDAVLCSIALQELLPKKRALSAITSIQNLTKPGGLNCIRAYIGSPETIKDKQENHTLFHSGELKSIYQARHWRSMVESYETYPLKPLHPDGSTSNVCDMVMIKPTRTQAYHFKLADQNRLSDPELAEHYLEQAYED
ncbi:MAG: hypothetical protein NVSMB46_09450 [Candidatus Saccharimonadales bacterium]